MLISQPTVLADFTIVASETSRRGRHIEYL